MFPRLKPIDDLSVAFGVRLTVLSLRALTWLPRTRELCLTVATPPLRVFLSSGCQLVHISTCAQTNLKRLSEACRQHRNSRCSRPCFWSSISILPNPLLGWLTSANSSVFNTHLQGSFIVLCAPMLGWFRPCPPPPASPPSYYLFIHTCTHKFLCSHLPSGTGLGTGWRQSRMRQRSCPRGVPKSVKAFDTLQYLNRSLL